MPTPMKSKAEVIDALAQVFRQHGYDDASLGRLSAATGLGKSSLYHHFPKGKEDMARAVLDAADVDLTALVLAPLRGSGAPADRLAQALSGLKTFYVGGSASCLLELFTAGSAAAVLGSAVGDRLDVLRAAFAALARDGGASAATANARAEAAVVAIQGALVVARGTDDVGVFERALDRLPDLLLR